MIRVSLTPIQFLVALTALFLPACATAAPIPPTQSPTQSPISHLQSPTPVPGNTDPTLDPGTLLGTQPPTPVAVPGEPRVGNYIANADQSILVAAYWIDNPEHPLVANKWHKVGWFRPASAELTIGGDLLIIPDPNADTTFSTEIPDGYPTRFTPSGIMFYTPGCWQITATAANKELTFIVYVAP